MSKKHISKAFKFIANSALRSLAVFLILGAAVVVYAASTDSITWPTTSPGPATGVVGQFIGLSKNAAGSDYEYVAVLNGYVDTNNKACSYYGKSAHVCSVEEMLHSYAYPTQTLSDATGEVYINGGSPGYYAPLKDCDAWTKKDNTNLARYWDFSDDLGKMTNCNAEFSFACCD